MTELFKVTLMDIYVGPGHLSLKFLYDLLAESDPNTNISHTAMPSWIDHEKFVRSQPYTAWYLIMWETKPAFTSVGAIYLTKDREVGIRIAKAHIGKGFGTVALHALRQRHPGPLLANIAPGNERSIAFFKKHGARLIQHTYAL